jgi:hypothetical protein
MFIRSSLSNQEVSPPRVTKMNHANKAAPVASVTILANFSERIR